MEYRPVWGVSPKKSLYTCIRKLDGGRWTVMLKLMKKIQEIDNFNYNKEKNNIW